jgi:hypothetical protein
MVYITMLGIGLVGFVLDDVATTDSHKERTMPTKRRQFIARRQC